MAKITSKKQKVLKSVVFLTGEEDRLNVNGTAKNTLVLINVLNNTHLFLDYQPHKIYIKFTRESITLKTLVPSREENTFCTNLYEYKHKCSKSLRILDYGLCGNAITPLY